MVATDNYYKVMCGLLNCAVASDLHRPSRSF